LKEEKDSDGWRGEEQAGSENGSLRKVRGALCYFQFCDFNVKYLK